MVELINHTANSIFRKKIPYRGFSQMRSHTCTCIMPWGVMIIITIVFWVSIHGRSKHYSLATWVLTLDNVICVHLCGRVAKVSPWNLVHECLLGSGCSPKTLRYVYNFVACLGVLMMITCTVYVYIYVCHYGLHVYGYACWWWWQC